MMLLMLICLPIIAFSQQPGGGGQNREEMRKRFETRQAEFMTSELNITSEEGQRFWPVFDIYSREVRTVIKNSRNVDSLERNNKVLEVRRKYQNEFNQILGQERGMRVYPTADRFMQMTKGVMERRRQSGNRPGGGRYPSGGSLPY